MNIRDYYPTRYLSAAEVGARQIEVEISRVDVEKFKFGDGETEKPVIYFKSVSKGLLLNKTNADVIARAYGTDTDAWTGLKLILRIERFTIDGRERQGIQVQTSSPPIVQLTNDDAFKNLLDSSSRESIF